MERVGLLMTFHLARVVKLSDERDQVAVVGVAELAPEPTVDVTDQLGVE